MQNVINDNKLGLKKCLKMGGNSWKNLRFMNVCKKAIGSFSPPKMIYRQKKFPVNAYFFPHSDRVYKDSMAKDAAQ